MINVNNINNKVAHIENLLIIQTGNTQKRYLRSVNLKI